MTQRRARILAGAPKAAFELVIVFIGVLAALWVDAWQTERERHERAIAIAQAMSTEIQNLNAWFGPWRDSVDAGFRRWEEDVAAGLRPAPYYFRMPGAERGPRVGWEVGVASLLDTFAPGLVIEIGNMYHEWAEIGEKVIRYQASTEELVLPALGDPAIAWRARPGEAGESFRPSMGEPVELSLLLAPEYAANMALMQEVLAELDHKFAWADSVGVKLNVAIAEVR
jgi:hypothetical protein